MNNFFRNSLNTIVAALVAVASVATVSFADSPNFGEYTSAIRPRTTAKPAKPQNPAPAQLSAWSLLNATSAKDGAAVVGIDSYEAVRLLLQSGARGDTAKKFVSLASNTPVDTVALQNADGYVNTVLVVSEQPLANGFISLVEGSGFGKCFTGSVTESIASLNDAIAKETGIENAIGDQPDDPKSVLLLSIAKQDTAWENGFGPEPATIMWKGDKVEGFSGRAPYAETKAPNGATIHHVKMDNDVVFSVVFDDELDDHGVGPWLIEGIGSLDFAEAQVAFPNVEIENEINLKGFAPLKFAFDFDADFAFSESGESLYVGDAKQRARLTFDSEGLSAAAVTYAVLLSKDLGGGTKADFSLDRPAFVVWSYVDSDGTPMPTFGLHLVHP